VRTEGRVDVLEALDPLGRSLLGVGPGVGAAGVRDLLEAKAELRSLNPSLACAVVTFPAPSLPSFGTFTQPTGRAG
jgi:hypothetical protein